MKIVRGTAQLKFIPVYKCASCGKEKAGGTERLEVGFSSFTELTMLDRAYPSVHHMPVGWASYGPGKWKCEECAT